MSKVIHKPNSKSHLSQQHFNSLLHRGQKSKDPYNNKRLNFNPARLLLKTLGTSGIFSPRCSRTFNSDSKFNNYINNSKNLRIAGFSSAFILLILSALSIYPIVRSLNSAEAVTPTNSTTSLSITSSNSASVELLVKSDSGTFATSTSSQKLNFNVKTDNYAGYELTLLGKDDSYASLKNSSTNTTLTSISGSKESSEFSNGSWGYTLDGTNYLSAPDNETGYQIEKTSTPNKDTAKTYALGVGAKANHSTKAGTYTNTYVLTAVGNSTPYTIYYKDNTNDSSVANLPTTQDEATSAININLSDTIPTRTGYTFLKWCDGTVTENGTKCSGTLYGASASFGIDRTAASNVTTLYAVWTVNSYTLNITNNNTTSNPATSTTINFGGETTITVTPNAGFYLSEVSCPSSYTCSGYTTGSDATGAQTATVTNAGTASSTAGGTITFTATPSMTNVGELQGLSDALCTSTAAYATDNRDNQDYVIQRLDDGNCWMMTNLNLGATTLTTDLTSSNTNLSSTVTAATFNGWKKSSASNTLTAGEYIPVSGNDATNGLPYGTAYNYCAASAQTICTSTNSSNASYDICPKGWRLPVGGTTNDSTNEFNNLYKLYNTVTKMRASYTDSGAAFTLAGGFINSGGPTSQGSAGLYWSSTRDSDAVMYRLQLDTSDVYPDSGGARSRGYSIRCIKKSPLEEFGVSTMQDIGNLSISDKTALMAAMGEGVSYNISDSRDSNTYTIAKINGNLWMTQNLRYVGDTGSTSGSMIMKSATSNIASDTTISYGDLTEGNSYDVARLHVATSDQVPSGETYTATDMGVWYNYAATSVMTITGNPNSNTQTYDVCPKGWRLPTNSEDSGITSYATIFAPITGGRYGGSSVGNTDRGYWWSATPKEEGSSYRYLLLYNGNNHGLSINSNGGQGTGYYVRCILDTSTIEDATYMQDVTAAMVANTTDGATKTLTDSRDSQQYTVAKINGNLWMTRNLAIGCNGSGSTYGSDISSETLTRYNSNISSTWDTPTALLSSASSKTQTADYSTARMQCSGTYGAWYNYAAASAGTITGDNNKNDATSDICPKGWRLFTQSEYEDIINKYSSKFSPTVGGSYSNGTINTRESGCWWSATADLFDGTYRYSLQRSTYGTLGSSYGGRNNGHYVRCIRSAS